MGIKLRFFTTPTGMKAAVGIFVASTIISFFAGASWQRLAAKRQNMTPTPLTQIAIDNPPPAYQRPTLIYPSTPKLLPSTAQSQQTTEVRGSNITETLTFTQESTKKVSPTASKTNTIAPSLTYTSTLSPTPAKKGSVLINEIAWAGTTASNFDEWIELHNASSADADLTGWWLVAGDGEPKILLGGAISSGGYYLLERTDDDTIIDVSADLIYTGSLSNTGETLHLLDPTGKIIDTANITGGSWPAGDSESYASMERRGKLLGNSAVWGTNTGYVVNGHDAVGNKIHGTPKQKNSLLLPTPTPLPSPMVTPTNTQQPTQSPTPTASLTSTFTVTATNTPTSTIAATVTGLPSLTPLPTATSTAILESQLTINEILTDPASGISGDANGDGIRDYSQDEFIEIVNNSNTDIDISNWIVKDSDAIRHIFSEGTILSAQCAVIIFGGGIPTGTFGGALVQTASTGSLNLGNVGGDTVAINNENSNLVLIYIFGNEGNDNQSITRSPDIFGNDPLVKHNAVSGALFSPGTLTNGSPFTGCNP